MATVNEIPGLCKAVLEAENDWRSRGAEARRVAFKRFQELLHTIADRTGRPYEEILNEAIEEWVTLHFCSVATGTEGGERLPWPES